MLKFTYVAKVKVTVFLFLLHKDNATKCKMQFQNDDFIY